MKWLLPSLFFACSVFAEKPNVLLICVDDLRPELNCYGRDYIHSPNIDRLAARGTLFEKHYVQAPTCGASRFALLTGRYGPNGNTALFERAQKMAEGETVAPSLPERFREAGYTTVAVGKVSHHPGGLGGPDWNNSSIVEMPGAWDRNSSPPGAWKHPRGWMHGLAHGEMRIKRNTQTVVMQALEGDDSIYPDGSTIPAAIEELETLAAAEKPFFLAVGILRPHLPFGAPKKYLDLYQDQELPPIPTPVKPKGKTTWGKSGEFRRYDLGGKDPVTDPDFADEVRRHYAACVSYADNMVGKVLTALEESGKQENTIIVLWGDHGWHLGEHGVWGKHTLFEESLHSPLIIVAPQSKQKTGTVETVVETVDVFPTLIELAGLSPKGGLHGRSLVPFLETQKEEQMQIETHGYAYSYRGGNGTLRSKDYRFVKHQEQFYELYDHRNDPHEERNIAEDNPEVISEFLKIIKEKKKLSQSQD